jgi:hypothetical protein
MCPTPGTAAEGKTVVLASGNNNIKCEMKKLRPEVSSEDTICMSQQYTLLE